MVRVVGIEPTLREEDDFELGNWRYRIPIRRHDKVRYQPVSSGISAVAAKSVPSRNREETGCPVAPSWLLASRVGMEPPDA
jgi:hypothetical protein